jgi:hypothetical protein
MATWRPVILFLTAQQYQQSAGCQSSFSNTIDAVTAHQRRKKKERWVAKLEREEWLVSEGWVAKFKKDGWRK